MNEEEGAKFVAAELPQEKADAALKLLGLARRAGKLQVGFSAVERLARRVAGTLVLVSRDMGAAQKRKIGTWQGVRIVILPLDSSALGGAMGRDKVAVLGLADVGFKAGIAKLEA